MKVFVNFIYDVDVEVEVPDIMDINGEEEIVTKCDTDLIHDWICNNVEAPLIINADDFVTYTTTMNDWEFAD